MKVVPGAIASAISGIAIAALLTGCLASSLWLNPASNVFLETSGVPSGAAVSAAGFWQVCVQGSVTSDAGPDGSPGQALRRNPITGAMPPGGVDLTPPCQNNSTANYGAGCGKPVASDMGAVAASVSGPEEIFAFPAARDGSSTPEGLHILRRALKSPFAAITLPFHSVKHDAAGVFKPAAGSVCTGGVGNPAVARFWRGLPGDDYWSRIRVVRWVAVAAASLALLQAVFVVPLICRPTRPNPVWSILAYTMQFACLALSVAVLVTMGVAGGRWAHHAVHINGDGAADKASFVDVVGWPFYAWAVCTALSLLSVLAGFFVGLAV